jgi:hypothetical protein
VFKSLNIKEEINTEHSGCHIFANAGRRSVKEKQPF